MAANTADDIRNAIGFFMAGCVVCCIRRNGSNRDSFPLRKALARIRSFAGGVKPPGQAEHRGLAAGLPKKNKAGNLPLPCRLHLPDAGYFAGVVAAGAAASGFLAFLCFFADLAGLSVGLASSAATAENVTAANMAAIRA